jgi:hypothetical protein
MIEIDQERRAALAAIYLAANTGPYLYRQMRDDPTVRYLSEKYSSEELANTVRELDSQEQRTIDDITMAYACLVALTLRNQYSEASETAQYAFRSLRWGDEIVAAWHRNSLSHTFRSIPSRPMRIESTGNDATSPPDIGTTVVVRGH